MCSFDAPADRSGTACSRVVVTVIRRLGHVHQRFLGPRGQSGPDDLDRLHFYRALAVQFHQFDGYADEFVRQTSPARFHVTRSGHAVTLAMSFHARNDRLFEGKG